MLRCRPAGARAGEEPVRLEASRPSPAPSSLTCASDNLAAPSRDTRQRTRDIDRSRRRESGPRGVPPLGIRVWRGQRPNGEPDGASGKRGRHSAPPRLPDLPPPVRRHSLPKQRHGPPRAPDRQRGHLDSSPRGYALGETRRRLAPGTLQYQRRWEALTRHTRRLPLPRRNGYEGELHATGKHSPGALPEDGAPAGKRNLPLPPGFQAVESVEEGARSVEMFTQSSNSSGDYLVHKVKVIFLPPQTMSLFLCRHC